MVFLDSIDQATITKQYENEGSSVAFEWCRCSSQSIVVYHFYSQLVLPPYTVKVRGGRHSTTLGEGSSRWALVLPPNTIKIRGGRSIFLRHSQARVLPSHAVKTGRGRSTRYQAHVLPPYAVKTRGGRSVFRQGYVLPSHAIKTGRGRSTFHRLREAHVLPPYAVKTRGGCSAFRQAHVLPSHAIKTVRRRSTVHHGPGECRLRG